MTSKRKGKEIESSGSGAGKKQSTVCNHDIHFKDDQQRSRYKSLISKHISACRYLDANVMDRLEIEEHVIRLLNSNLVLRYLQRVMACTIWVGKREE